MNWNENLEKSIDNGRYPSVEAMEIRIGAFLGYGLITVAQAEALVKRLYDREGLPYPKPQEN